jgi:hypothetical protein
MSSEPFRDLLNFHLTHSRGVGRCRLPQLFLLGLRPQGAPRFGQCRLQQQVYDILTITTQPRVCDTLTATTAPIAYAESL